MKLKYLILSLFLVGNLCAVDFEAVSVWPTVLYAEGKQFINPSAETCTKAGYKLLRAEPATPVGSCIATREVIQDPEDATRAIVVLTFMDIPQLVPVAPTVITNVSPDRVVFRFTDKGAFQEVVWVDAPDTNTAVIK